MYHDKNSSSEGKIRKDLFIWVFVSVVMTAIALANVVTGDTTEVVVAADVGVSSGQSESTGAKSSTGKPIQSFKFEANFSIRDALAILGSMYQKNIVPTPNVDGMLAFRSLSNVTFEEAMDAILGDNFKYVQEGNLIKVYTRDEYKKIMADKERMITKVFTLYYISAAEAMKLISPVLSGVGTIQGSSPPVTVATTGESITAGAGGGDTMALNDHIIICDYPENIKAAGKLLNELDVRPKQVLVEATILSCTLTEGMKLGVDLNFMAGFHLDGTTTTTSYTSGSGDSLELRDTATTPMGQLGGGLITSGTPIETSGFATVGGSGLRIGITSGDVAAIVTALETVTDTTVLANPKILAINKQLGQVYIGTKIGYVSQTTQTQTSTTQAVQFLDTGTKLSFRPYIGDDGYIRMDIHPKDSSGTLKANNIPDETSTELATNIMVKDGQTIVIGGLFRDSVVTSRSQIPLLGDLPFVGAAFRSTSDTVTRQEVIVLLTPHIIEEPSDTKGSARAEDISRKRFGAKEELQWPGRARLADDRYAEAAKYYVDGDNEAALKELEYVLTLRPAFLEAMRLKERIMDETDPNALGRMERNIRQDVEKEDSDKWLRR